MRNGRVLVGWVLPALLSGSVAARALDVSTALRFELSGGYASGRNPTIEDHEAVFFYQAMPGLELNWLGKKTETALRLDYRHTLFPGQSDARSTGLLGDAAWRRNSHLWETGIRLSGGAAADVVPGEDERFIGSRGYLLRGLRTVPVEISLDVAAGQSVYDGAVATQALDRTEAWFEFRPGLRWAVSRRMSVWSQARVETLHSDWSADCYTGWGLLGGCDLRPTPRLTASVWLETGVRVYEANAASDEPQTDRIQGGGWLTYRLRPWQEWFMVADWASTQAADGATDRTWQVCCGIKCVVEHLTTPR